MAKGSVEGQNIARIRSRRGLTQQELSRLSGINKASISQIETGNIGLSKDKREALARALEVEIAEFYRSPEAKHQTDERLRLGLELLEKKFDVETEEGKNALISGIFAILAKRI